MLYILLFLSAVSKEGQVAPRTGFFHVFQRKELLVKQYDPNMEDISPEPPHPALVQRLKDNLKELDCFLGPFPYESWKKWISLTGHISGKVSMAVTKSAEKLRKSTKLFFFNLVTFLLLRSHMIFHFLFAPPSFDMVLVYGLSPFPQHATIVA